MADLFGDEKGALGDRRAVFVRAAASVETLAEPLEVILSSLIAPASASLRFPGYRLTRLVGARLDLDEADIRRLAARIGFDVSPAKGGAARAFDSHLRRMLQDHDLGLLFIDDQRAPHHHGVRPAGYDFDRDEVIPRAMEHWRACYRSLPDERQMLVASILWLYRGGKDNVWLRRVPCTWHAAEAIDRMNAAAVFRDWVRLYALYPGW